MQPLFIAVGGPHDTLASLVLIAVFDRSETGGLTIFPPRGAGVLTIGLMTDALRALFESQEPGVLNSIAASAAATRDALIAELAHHPIFESARRYREAELAAYDPPLLREFLSTRRVLRRSEAPWGMAPSDPAAERAVSLMSANSATHVIVLSQDPVDLIVLAVPVTSADPATETALALVRRLLALTPEAA